MESKRKFHGFKKDTEQKQPVLSSQFRLAVEKQVKKFIESSEDSFEIPVFFNANQREFINEYSYSLGLKCKFEGKGLNTRITLFRNSEKMMKLANSTIKLRDHSKLTLQKLFEKLDEHKQIAKPSFDEILPNIKSEPKLLSVHMTRIGSVAQGKKIFVSVPPKREFREFRKRLPIFKYRNELINVIRNNKVVVIEASTGSGKSTQIPNYILEEFAAKNRPCRVIVAEPKRVCATSLAERVSYERGETVGSTVGFQIRLESRISPTSNLIYVTNGVILRMLMTGKPEEFFNDVTALIIDEVHERDRFSDFLMLCVREYINVNPKLRVVIMSATMNAQSFSDYFGGCKIFKVEGSNHDVEEHFLEDTLKMINFPVPKKEKQPEENDKKLDVKNISDETKSQAEDLLMGIDESSNNFDKFIQFVSMVERKLIPVDIRHQKTGKTALMMAVGHGDEAWTRKLLGLKADATETLGGVNVFDMAVNDQRILMILQTATDLMDTPRIIKDSKASQEVRDLLDAYYDSLASKGCFLDDVIDHNIIVTVIREIHFNTDPARGILVFLPGHDEIIQLANLLYNVLDTNYEIFILHSQMNTRDQVNVFEELPQGTRKIVLATNIAESSLTIDVFYVIDTGKEKVKNYNPATQVSCLKVQWISKASAKQRKGRAGRIQSGFIFRMYSRDRYESFEESAEPEFTRCNLSDICLQSKMIAMNGETIEEFLAKSITPPKSTNVKLMVKYLVDIGALDSNEAVTQLGLYLADIPLEAKYAKMLIYGIIYKCIDPILTLVSILSNIDPFRMSFKVEDRENCHKIKCSLEEQSFSDHFVLLRIFQKWNIYKSEYTYDGGFCEDYFVSAGSLDQIMATRLKIVGFLRSIRLIHSVGNLAELNEHSSSWAMIKAVLSVGSYPGVARVFRGLGEISSAVDSKIVVNPGSVLKTNYNKKLTKDTISSWPVDWMIFEEKNLAGSFSMAKHCTLVTSTCVALTAGRTIHVKADFWSEHNDDKVLDLKIDDFLIFQADSDAAHALEKLRKKLDNLRDRFLANVARFRFSDVDNLLLQGFRRLLDLEDDMVGFNTKFKDIGARPRVITRNSDVDLDEMKNNYYKAPETEIKTETEAMKENIQPQVVETKKIRYYMLEIHDENIVKEMKSKVISSGDEAKIPEDFFNFLVHAERADRGSRKMMVLRSDKEVLGIVSLMDFGESEVKKEKLKFYFLGDKRIDLTVIRNFINNDIDFNRITNSKFIELSSAVGKFCCARGLIE